MSTGTDESIIPVMPEKTKLIRPPKANSIAVLRRSLPPQIVATQAKTLIPVGTEISMVENINKIRIQPGVPLANM